MSDLRTAAKAALWAFQYHVEQTWPTDRSTAAIAALRAALAQQEEPCPNCASLETQNTELDQKLAELEQAEPVQEPVAWYQKRGQEVLTSHPACWGREDEPWTPLYTAPPQRKPLTDEEVEQCFRDAGITINGPRWTNAVRNVERAHGIKE